MSAEEPVQRRGPLPDLQTLLIDRNGDGFPDDVVGILAIPDELHRECWIAVFNLCARLGLGSSGFSPPIVGREPELGRVSITVRDGDAERINALAMGEIDPQSGQSTPDNPAPGIDLRDPWSIDGFLLDTDGDQAADDSAIHIILPEQIPFELGAALSSFVTRLGVESGGLTLPIAGDQTFPFRRALRISINRDQEATLTRESTGDLTFSGTADALARAFDRLARSSSGFLSERPGHNAVEWLRRSIAGWTDDGKAAAFRAALESANPDRVVILESEPRLNERLTAQVEDACPNCTVAQPSPDERVVFDHQWSAEWEGTRLLRALEEDMLPTLAPGEPVDLIAMVSEPPSVRRRIRGQISRLMLNRGFTEGSLHVLDAFKPGLSWLEEIVLPELQNQDEIARIEISARNWDPEQHAGQLDMPIRWLQELFPGDEILANSLGIELKQVRVSLQDDQTDIYRVVAWDASGNQLLARSFSPLWRRIDYLAGFGDVGNVTVTTGGVLAFQEGRTHRVRVLTDPELFWRYMQGELLPLLRRYILGLTENQPTMEKQPFFDDLFFNLRISSSDAPYEIREERHSAAEALHEDIYFNVLDFVEELGRRTTGDKLSAPGSIRPFVTVTPGRQPEARIRLTSRPAGIARIISDGRVQTVQPPHSTVPTGPAVRGLSFNERGLTVHIDSPEETTEIGAFLEALAAECPPDKHDVRLRIPTEHGSIEIGVPDRLDPEIPTTVAEGPIPDDTIISNPELYPHLNRLAKHPEVTVVPAAETSWQGRPIPAVAVTSEQKASIWSMSKLSHFKPTKLIVARHHANEVASTTSALQMIEALVSQDSGAAMLRGLNAVFLPLENPDGAALHDELRRQNPTWKHHPARYNATGYEFGEDQGNPDSQYGEGRVRDLVWQSCLPDIVVDNHGVPSHEWAQLFAGFGSPPRFGVSYWQVQALLYGILPWFDHPAHRAAMEAARDRVSAEIAADEELLYWNRIYSERYRTWGHQWVPDRFPMELHREMIFHVQQVDPDSVRGRRSYAVRYPSTTILNWITEVCDETVEGAELQRTARAHLLANKAVMEFLRDYSRRIDPQVQAVPGGVHIRIGRERPLRPDQDNA